MRGSVVKRPSGSFAIRYYGPDKSRYYETIGRNREDAERALTARLRELDTGTWRPPSEETLRTFAERWIERRRPRLAKSTIAGYQGYLDRHVYPALGGRPLASLRPLDFDELVGRLEAAGMPAGSVRNAIVPVRSILSDAVRLGLLPSNPAARVDLPPPPASAGKEIPPEHLNAIRQALVDLAPADPFRPGETDLCWPLFSDVALGTAMRFSELAGLTWGACDLEGRAIRVERAVVLGETKTPKSGHVRTVPMFQTVAVALRALASRALDRGRYGPGELVFGTVRGTPLNTSNVHARVWQPALTTAKLKGSGYRLHDLRHTAVSRLIAAGADVAIVQAVAGHASAATTLKIYTHLRDTRLRDAAMQFDPAATRALAGH